MSTINISRPHSLQRAKSAARVGFSRFSGALFVLAAICVAPTVGAEEKPQEFLVRVPPLESFVFRIPPRKEIVAIEVELYNSPFSRPNIGPFRLDDKYIDEVYGYFANCEIDQLPLVFFPDFASLRVTLDSGEVLRIAVHTTRAEGPINFSILGIRLVQKPAPGLKVDEANFEHILRNIHAQQNATKAKADVK